MTSLDGDRSQQVILSVAAAASKAGPILMGTAMAVYVGRRGGSPLAVGLVLTVYFFGLMVCSPLWGALGDITGRRRDVLLLASGAAALAVLPLTVVGGVWLPLGVRTLYAAFAAGYLPTLLTIVSERGGASARGRSIGLFSTAQAVGFTAGQAAAGFLLGWFAPWLLYLVVAGLGGLVFLTALVVRDPTPAPRESLGRAALFEEMRRRLFPTKAGRTHLRSNGLHWLYAAVGLRNTTVIGTTSLLPVYLVGELGVTEATMGLLLAVNPAGQVGCMYAVGRIADRVGRKPLIVLGMVGSGAFPLSMAGASTLESQTARLLLVGAGMVVLAAAFSGLRVGAVSFISDVAPPDRESELIGLRSTTRGLGGMLGPVVLGAVATVTTFEAAFTAGSLLAFVGAALCARGLTESLPDQRSTGRGKAQGGTGET